MSEPPDDAQAPLRTALAAWFAGRVDKSVQVSADRTWCAIHERPLHPAGPDLDLPLRPGRLWFRCRRHRREWRDPRLDRVLSSVWSPTKAVAGGLLATPDGIIGAWIGDPGTETLTIADAAAQVTPEPVWAAPDRMVFAETVPSACRSPVRGPWVFESAPGAHVRVLPPVARASLVRLLALDPETGTSDELPVPVGNYLQLATDGAWLAAVIPGAHRQTLTVTSLAGTSTDPARGQSHVVDGRPLAVHWLPSRGRPSLVVALQVEQDLEVRALDPGTGSWRTLWCRPGLGVHSHRPPGATEVALLVREPTGTVVLTVTGDAVTAHAISQRAADPALTQIAQIDTCQKQIRLALTAPAHPSKPRSCVLFAPESRRPTVLHPDHHLRLEPGDVLCEVIDWHGGVATVDSRKRVGSIPLQWTSPILVDDPTGTGDLSVTIHPPLGADPPAGTLMWLEVGSTSGSTPAAPGHGEPRSGDSPVWHTRHGFLVAQLRLSLAWWADTPDASLRSRIAETVTAVLTSAAVTPHLVPGQTFVGGHSFAATMALLLLADTDFMTGAIVRSGAYSRQVTMLGFQQEARTLWQAPAVYHDFDTVYNADQITDPVLVIHGRADTNPATPYHQACLLYQALTANGTPCRLVVLPHDGHTYRSRHGITAALVEEAAWLHRWVR